MNSSNNYNICSKCYINIHYVVADGMQSFKAVAMLLNSLYDSF